MISVFENPRLQAETANREMAVDREAPWIKGLMWRKVRWGLYLCKEGQREINMDEASPGRKTKVAGTFCLCGYREAVRILLRNKQWESMW